jgi:hypothetical protein
MIMNIAYYCFIQASQIELYSWQAATVGHCLSLCVQWEMLTVKEVESSEIYAALKVPCFDYIMMSNFLPDDSLVGSAE